MSQPDSAYRRHFEQPAVVNDYLTRYADGRNGDAQAWEAQRHVLAALISDRRATSGLDYACGGGRILAAYPETVTDLHGWDTSTAMLARASAAAPLAELRQIDLAAAPAPAGFHFDVITAFRLMLNLEPDLRVPVLHRLAGLLTPGGTLIVDNHGARWSLRHPAIRFGGGSRDLPAAELSDRQMRGMFAAAGLRVVDRSGFGWLPDVAHRGRAAGAGRAVDGWLLRHTTVPAGAIRVMYVTERA